jgi:hypothetical protein
VAAPAYNDPAHVAFVAALRRYPTPCYVAGCGDRATTGDHVPPLGLHTHVRGSGCCSERPSCVRHNLGAGRAVAIERARRESRRAFASRAW